MKRNISIQLKAVLLLLVFAMNTLLGFACAVGLDMRFNTTHHYDEVKENAVHTHTDANKHVHHQTAKSHFDKKDDSKKDDCCNDGVIKFQNLDKNISQSIKAVDAMAGTAILTTTINVNNLKELNAGYQKNIVRNFHPPPHNIRIAIRSFQI